MLLTHSTRDKESIKKNPSVTKLEHKSCKSSRSVSKCNWSNYYL